MAEQNALKQTKTTNATTIATANEMKMSADMPAASTTKMAATTSATTTTMPTTTSVRMLSVPRARTLTRTPEMDGSVDVLDILDVDAEPDDADSITQELAHGRSPTPPPATHATPIHTPPTTLSSASMAANEDTNNLDESKPFKVKDVTRHIRKAVVATTLAELRLKVSAKFQRTLPTIHLDCDGTEIDDEEYFGTLEPNAELIAVFPGEHWRDPSDYNANIHRSSLDARRLKKLVGQLQNNYPNDADMDTLSNMDPNSLLDITGRELKESDYCLQSESQRCSTELSC